MRFYSYSYSATVLHLHSTGECLHTVLLTDHFSDKYSSLDACDERGYVIGSHSSALKI